MCLGSRHVPAAGIDVVPQCKKALSVLRPGLAALAPMEGREALGEETSDPPP